MSDALAKVEKQRRREEPREKLPAQERYALKKLQREAKDAGAELASNGEGGLPPSLVLGVMRRDGYRCKGCGEQKMLGVHHKGHLENPPSKWLAAKGRANDPNNIVTLCTSCHDRVHERDRKAGDEKRD